MDPVGGHRKCPYQAGHYNYLSQNYTHCLKKKTKNIKQDNSIVPNLHKAINRRTTWACSQARLDRISKTNGSV